MLDSKEAILKFGENLHRPASHFYLIAVCPISPGIFLKTLFFTPRPVGYPSKSQLLILRDSADDERLSPIRPSSTTTLSLRPRSGAVFMPNPRAHSAQKPKYRLPKQMPLPRSSRQL